MVPWIHIAPNSLVEDQAYFAHTLSHDPAFKFLSVHLLSLYSQSNPRTSHHHLASSKTMPKLNLPLYDEKMAMSPITRTAHEERWFKIKGCTVVFMVLMFMMYETLGWNLDGLAMFGCCLVYIGVSLCIY